MPPPVPESPHDLVMFVSCVQDKPVTRLSLRAGPKQLIGAEKGADRVITYNPAAVVALTRAEVAAFGAVYERTIQEGNLVRRTRQDWEAWRAAQKAAQKKALEQAGAPAGGAPS